MEKMGLTSMEVSYTDVSISLSVIQIFDSYSRETVASLRGTVSEKTLKLESAGEGEDRSNGDLRDESDDDIEQKFEDDWTGGTESAVRVMLVVASPSSQLQE